MIRINLNGIDLDLSTTEIRWESVSSLLSDDAFQSDYSFPFVIPLTDANMKAFGFLNKVEVPQTSVSFNVIFYIDDRSIRCQLVLNGVNKKGFNFSLAGGIKGLSNIDKKLSELQFNPATINLGNGFSNLSNFKTDDWNNIIAFAPHFNPDFYGDENPDFNGVINRQNAQTGDYLLNTIASGNKHCLVPFIYIHYILQTIFKENSLTPAGTYWNDKEISNALLYNNYALDKRFDYGCLVSNDNNQTFNYAFTASPYTVVGSILLHTKTNPITYDPLNNWISNTYFSSTESGDYQVTFKGSVNYTGLLAPGIIYVKIIEVDSGATVVNETTAEYSNGWDTLRNGDPFEITGVFSYTASNVIYAAFQFYPFKDDDTAPNPTDVSVTLNKGATFKIERVNYNGFNLMDQVVTLTNHVPDITVGEFLNLIKNWAQVDFTIDWVDQKVNINFAEELIKNANAVDLTAIADPNYELTYNKKKEGFTVSYDFGNDALAEDNFKTFDRTKLIGEFNTQGDLPTPIKLDQFAIVLNTNQVFVSVYDSGTFRWNYFTDYYQPVKVGNGGTERVIQLAPMLMTRLATNLDSSGAEMPALMPQIKELGSSSVFPIGINAPSLRVVFMRGVNFSPSFGGFYILASSTHIDINGHQVGNYNLRLQGSGNWYARFLEKILLAIDNAALVEYKIMLPLSYIKYKGKVQINNVNYLIKNISMPIGNTLKQSICKLLKL